MTLEQRIEALTVALVELTETVRDLQTSMGDNAHVQNTTQRDAGNNEPAPESPVDNEPQPVSEQPANEKEEDQLTREELQSECIKKVRETDGDSFKHKIQQVLKEYNVKTIKHLPDDAVEPVWQRLFGGNK